MTVQVEPVEQAAPVPSPVEALILERLDRIERLLLDRLPVAKGHDETIRAGLAVADPPDRKLVDQPQP